MPTDPKPPTAEERVRGMMGYDADPAYGTDDDLARQFHYWVDEIKEAEAAAREPLEREYEGKGCEAAHGSRYQQAGPEPCAICKMHRLEREVERLKEQLTAATAIPTDEQIKKWEAFAQAKISVLNRLAEAIIQDEPASSGWLRQQCGLSADEWHGAGELIAALICFGVDKGFLDWHAAGMADIDMPDQIEAARAEGRREGRRERSPEVAGLKSAVRIARAEGRREGLEEACRVRCKKCAGGANVFQLSDGTWWHHDVACNAADIRDRIQEYESRAKLDGEEAG